MRIGNLAGVCLLVPAAFAAEAVAGRAAPARPRRVTYAGRSADAPWRKAAAARIEKHRKAGLVV